MFSRLLLILLSTIAIPVKAENVTWLTFNPVYSYRDLTMACTSEYGSQVPIHLALETTNALEIVRATFIPSNASSVLPVGYYSYVWSPKEIAGLKLERDEKNRIWVNSMSLSAALTDWVLRNQSGTDGCPPTEQAATIGPAPFTFKFVRDDLVATPVAFSNEGKFSGRRKDGLAYNAEIHWQQTPYIPRPR